MRLAQRFFQQRHAILSIRCGRDHRKFGGKPALLGHDIVRLHAALARLSERSCAYGDKLALQFFPRVIDALRILRRRRRHDFDRCDLGDVDAQRLERGDVPRPCNRFAPAGDAPDAIGPQPDGDLRGFRRAARLRRLEIARSLFDPAQRIGRDVHQGEGLLQKIDPIAQLTRLFEPRGQIGEALGVLRGKLAGARQIRFAFRRGQSHAELRKRFFLIRKRGQLAVQRLFLFLRPPIEFADAGARCRDALVKRDQPLVLVARALMRQFATRGLGLGFLRSLVEADRSVAFAHGKSEIGLHLRKRRCIGEPVAFAQFCRQGVAVRFERSENRAHIVERAARRFGSLKRRFPSASRLRLPRFGLFQRKLRCHAREHAFAARAAEHLADLGFDHAAEQRLAFPARLDRLERLALAHP